MKRIEALLKQKEKSILSLFLTAGYPEKESLLEWVPVLEKEGVDFIEVGIPFSDPLADGQTIQDASTIALENGMDLNLIFEQIKTIRETSNLPIILMGYLNPILAFGMNAFLDQCIANDIDGIIIPDLPAEAYQRDYAKLFAPPNLSMIFLATPLTDQERLKEITRLSSPFVYYMSTASTTGKAKNYTVEQIREFQRFQSNFPNQKAMLGFGIHNQRNFKTANYYFSGGIIGSAFIRKQKNKAEAIAFIRSLSSPSSV